MSAASLPKSLHSTPATCLEVATTADDSPLTIPMINELSQRLGQDWKRFARGTYQFTDADIDNIDAEEQSVYDKCYSMVSMSKVSIQRAKLSLTSLGRSDLLYDVFHVAPPSAHLTASTECLRLLSSDLTGPIEKKHSEPTVSDLRYKHVEKLCKFLDHSHGIGVHSWQDLGNVIFQGDRDAKDQIESMHLSYCGGGSPAKGFLKGLTNRYPTFTVAEFKNIAIKLQRRDISHYIESLNCTPEKYFRDLSATQREKIARDLDKSIRGVHDWRMFADAVGFSNDEIAEFKLTLKELDKYSPTECLIDLMKSKYPRLSLTKVKVASSSIGRNDVAQYLGTVMEEIVSS